MKKNYINETSLGNIKEYGLLPDFLFKMVKDHKTSLGDNEAFPKIGEYPFDYSIIKKRFEDVSFHIKSTLNEFDEDSLMSELSSLVTECKGLEEPIKDSLEKLAENAINRLFAIPSGTINFTFKLVGKVEFKNSPRITPESDENLKYSFKDIADIDHSNKAVEKRRFINALIQGGARRMLETALSSDEVAFADLGKLNPHLITLYKKILYINDYLLFTKPEKLDDKKPMQGSYVETHLGSDGNRSTIDAQGIIFPLLLQEAIKGIFELFSSHGLPSDRSKAMYVIKKADYILAEPWDMRFGPTLWDMIFGGIEDSNIIPYAFTNLIELPTDEFNLSVREILADTEAGKEIINGIVNDSQYDSDYQEFTNRINARNMDKSVIADSYFTAAELDGLDIDSEESNVIEESEDGNVDYIKLIENATVDNIDFEEGRTIAGNGEELILTIKGVKIPQLLVSLVVYLVGIDVEGKPARVLNLHIILGKEIQGMGLGTKIYTKMVYEFGSLYSWDATRSNKEHIGKIFKRLNSDPKIDVTTIPKKEGGVDYLAVLKGHNIFESAEKDKALITEGWGKDKKRIIDRCVKLIKDANPTITTSKAYALEKKIEDTYFHEYGMSSSLKIRKFEPMITKILVEELGYPDCPTTSKEQNFLKSVTKCIWNYEVKQGKTPMANNSFEGNGPDNFETLYAKYKPFMEEIEKSGMNLNGKHKSENDYEIIHIPDFETANKWGDWSFPGNANEYGKLCYTTGEAQWESFTNYGANTCFLCLNEKTYQNWPKDTYPEDNENTPYDAYGLSMIWVFVDQNGNLAYSNTRWNHHGQEKIPNMPYGGKGVDESFSEGALEEILDKPFDEAFDSENSFKAMTDEVNEKITLLNNDGNDFKIDEYFGSDKWKYSLFNKKYHLLKIQNENTNKENLLRKENGKWELLLPNVWFDNIESIYIEAFDDVIAVVNVNNSHNLIDSNGNFVLPNNLWCDDIEYFDAYVCGKRIEGFGIGKNGQRNVFIPGKGFLFDKFTTEYSYEGDVLLYTFNSDGSITVYPPDGGSPMSLNDILKDYIKSGFQEFEPPSYLNGRIAFDGNIVKLRGSFGDLYNIINKNTGELLLDWWVRHIDKMVSEFYLIEFNSGHVNVVNKDGKLLVKKEPLDWPSRVYLDEGDYFIIEGSERDDLANISDLNGNFLFDINDENSWITDISVYENNMNGERYIIKLCDYDNDKYNMADENFNLLWKQPRDKWFDSMKFSHGIKSGFVPVKIGQKWNYFDLYNRRMLYDAPIEDWFESTYQFRPDCDLLACVLVNRSESGLKNYNFIDVNGELLFEDSYINEIEARSDMPGIFFVKNRYKKYNVVDTELGHTISDKWFDRVESNDDAKHILCFANYEQFIYDTDNAEFIENKSKNSSHDFSDYADGLKEYVDELKFDDVKELIPNELYRVTEEFTIGYKSNLIGLINGRPQYLLPNWCRGVGCLHGNGISCRISQSTYNIFNVSTLRYVFDESMMETYWEDDAKCFVVTKDGIQAENFVDRNCNILLKKWPNHISYWFTDDNNMSVYKVSYGDNSNFFVPERNGFLIKKNYTYSNAIRYSQGIALIVGEYSGGKILYNIIKDGEPALYRWAERIDTCDTYNVLVEYKDEHENSETNVYDFNTGEFISDEPIKPTCAFDAPFHYKVVKNGKINFLRNLYDISYTLSTWADSVTEFDNQTYALAIIDGKEYTLINRRYDPIVEGDIYGLGANGGGIVPQLIQTIKNARTYKKTTGGHNSNTKEAGEAALTNKVLISTDGGETNHGDAIDASFVGYIVNNNGEKIIYVKDSYERILSFKFVQPEYYKYYIEKLIGFIS